ncbi:MAG: GNAT family N-acetyltransferase [Candidatus Bathyarchaeia archaeon]|jgi:CelD/BcsL family acetyltransferase involved in cellulose biosynthesis
MIGIREFTNLKELRELEDTWNSVLQKSKDNNVFSTWEWLSLWWQYFGKESQLRVLVAQEGDEVLGIAPLMLSKCQGLNLGEFRRIEFIGTPEALTHSFILLKNEKECLKIFLKYLMQQSDWDCIDLRGIYNDTVSAELLRQFFSGSHACKTTLPCCYLELPDSTKELANVPSHLRRRRRSELRRIMRSLREKYEVEIKTYEDFSSIEEAMGVLFDLHLRRMRSKKVKSNLCDKTVRDFQIAVAKSFAEKGWLSLYFLTANDKPVASIYSYNYGPKKQLFLTGFDPTFNLYSVGSQLWAHVIETSIEKGLKEVDFGYGYELYKARWANKVRWTQEIQYVRKGFVATTYKLMNDLVYAGSRFMRRTDIVVVGRNSRLFRRKDRRDIAT